MDPSNPTLSDNPVYSYFKENLDSAQFEKLSACIDNYAKSPVGSSLSDVGKSVLGKSSWQEAKSIIEHKVVDEMRKSGEADDPTKKGKLGADFILKYLIDEKRKELRLGPANLSPEALQKVQEKINGKVNAQGIMMMAAYGDGKKIASQSTLPESMKRSIESSRRELRDRGLELTKILGPSLPPEIITDILRGTDRNVVRAVNRGWEATSLSEIKTEKELAFLGNTIGQLEKSLSTIPPELPVYNELKKDIDTLRELLKPETVWTRDAVAQIKNIIVQHLRTGYLPRPEYAREIRDDDTFFTTWTLTVASAIDTDKTKRVAGSYQTNNRRWYRAADDLGWKAPSVPSSPGSLVRNHFNKIDDVVEALVDIKKMMNKDGILFWDPKEPISEIISDLSRRGDSEALAKANKLREKFKLGPT